jgi:hypothetical protein
VNIDVLAESFFAAELMNEAAAYVARGRMLEHSSDQDVLDVWVARFNCWFDVRSPENAQAMSDASAELRLRGLEEPHDDVRSKINALRAEVDHDDDHPEELVRRIVDYLAAMRAPQN